MNIPTLWPPIFGALVLIIAAASVVSNSLTLLSLRKRYGLRKVLGGVTCLLVGCLAFTNLLHGLVGLPLAALDRMLDQNWPPVSSVHARAVICGLTFFSASVLYNTGTWYLLTMAVVRCALVWWPQTTQKLKKTFVILLLCAVPAVIGVVGTSFDLFTHAMRIDKAGDRCTPIPYEMTLASIQHYSRYQMTAFALFVAVPEPIGFVLYVIVYVRLYFAKKKLRNLVGSEAINMQPMSENVVKDGGIEVHQIYPHSATVTNGNQQPPLPITQNEGADSTMANILVKPNARKERGGAVRHRGQQPDLDRKLHVVKILGFVYVCDLLCICPQYLAWMFGFYSNMRLDNYQLIVGDLLNLIYLCAIPMNSIMYAVVSKDFKQAYKSILKCS